MIPVTTRTLIEEYQSRGWRLVLLKEKDKAPSESGWPTANLSLVDVLTHMELGGNLGVVLGEPSGHLADIDLDCAQAVAAASAFLPPTGRIHGRASKPSSHYWYISPVTKTTRLADTDGTCLLELRGAGTQTALPPSVHPSGESFAWIVEGDPATVSHDVLRSAFLALGTCVLMARHWPKNGARHECALALSGMMLNAGWPLDLVTKIVVQAAKLAGDEEWGQRKKDVETTNARLDAAEPVTSAGTLAALVGDAVVTRLREWLGLDASTEQTTAALLRPLASLSKPVKPEAIETSLRRVVLSMNGASPLRRETVREAAIEMLKGLGVASPARMVDAAFETHSPHAEDAADGQGRPIEFPVIELWPEPIHGAEVLDEVAATFKRFVALPEHAEVALALWAAHAHAESAAFVSPILCLTSPTKQCGKTTTKDVMAQLVPKPLPSSNLIGATVFRTVERYVPTLLVDEGDTFLRDNEELRGILNSGHTRPSAQVVRLVAVGDGFEPRAFSTWCPKLIALIRRLPPTLEDRSVVISLRRRAKHERVEKLRLDRLSELDPIRRRLARWVADHLEDLKASDPTVPESLADRAADNWRPLLALADAVGGEWPERARQAALALSGSADEIATDVLLLADLKEAWPELDGSEYLPTADLIARLNALPGRPWSRKGISGQRLASLLRTFGIKPTRTEDARGYRRADLEDAWARYGIA